MFCAEAAWVGGSIKQLDFIGAFLQANVHHRTFVKLPSIYGDLFPEYRQYCGRPLRLKKSMYGTTTAGKDWGDDHYEWMKSVGFVQSDVQGSLLWRINPDSTVIRVLNYIDDEIYYVTTLEAIAGKLSNETEHQRRE